MFTEVKLEKRFKGLSSCPTCGESAGNAELKYFECKTCGAKGCMHCLYDQVRIKGDDTFVCKHCNTEFEYKRNISLLQDDGAGYRKHQTLSGRTGIVQIGYIQ